MFSPSLIAIMLVSEGGGHNAMQAAIAAADLRKHVASASSATAVLDRWCVDHGLATAGSVRAEKIGNGPVVPDKSVRKILALKEDETVNLRHVRLWCGGHLLSSAQLWYVPGRLPADIEAQLQETDTPFGRAVSRLKLERHSRGTISYWPKGKIKGSGDAIPTDLFSQRAVLGHAGQAPLAYTVETYHSGVLDTDGQP